MPSLEDERRRERVVRELGKVMGVTVLGLKASTCNAGRNWCFDLVVILLQIVMEWAKRVAYEQGKQHWITSATVLTFGSYALGVRRMPNLSTISWKPLWWCSIQFNCSWYDLEWYVVSVLHLVYLLYVVFYLNKSIIAEIGITSLYLPGYFPARHYVYQLAMQYCKFVTSVL